MASQAEPAPCDYFQVALSRAAWLPATVADRIRLDSLFVSLIGSGVTADDSRIALWAAAAICRSDDECRRFLDGFDIPAVAEGSVADLPAPPMPPRIGRWTRRRWIAIAGVVAIGLIAFMLVWHFLPIPPPPSPPPTDCSVSGECQAPQGLKAVTTPTLVPKWEMQRRLTAGLAALAIPLFCILLWHVWTRIRRKRALDRVDPLPDQASPAHPSQQMPDFFAQSSAAFRKLLRHELAPSLSINVRATIAATIQAGGFPSLHFGRRRRTPEYFFLSERRSPNDHMPLVAKMLHERMAREQVPVRHYEFFDEPFELRRVDRARQDAAEPLSTLLAAHPNARVLLLMEGHDIRPDDQLPPWFAALTENRDTFHLNPRRPALWNDIEDWLAREQVDSHHIGDGGLAGLGDPRGVPGAKRGKARRTTLWDLPESYASHQSDVLDGGTVQALEAGAVIADLRRWLDRSQIQWLAALALYPVITPRLTIALGKHITDAAGKPLLSEGRLIELARLPWLRAGHMPDWLRVPLARTLTRKALRQAVPVLQAMLLDPRPDDVVGDAPVDPDDGMDARARADLIEWLIATIESELHDRLLIDALKEKQPRALGRDWFAFLPRPLRRVAANRTAREAIMSLLALAAIVALFPPAVDQSTKTTEMVIENHTEMVPDPQASGTPKPRPTASGVGPVPSPTPSASPSGEFPSPIVTGTPPKGVLISGPNYVFFDQGETNINLDSSAQLGNTIARLAAKLLTSDSIEVEIRCFTDRQFNPNESLALTQKYCSSVKDFIILHFISERSKTKLSFYTLSVGSVRNISPNTKLHQARRAEIGFFGLVSGPAPTTSTPALTPPSRQPQAGASNPIPTPFPTSPVTPRPRPEPLPPCCQEQAPKPVLKVGNAQRPPSETQSDDDQSDRLYDSGDFLGASGVNSSTCAKGSYRGCFWNGYLYEAGKGVTRDPDQAIHWYDKACKLRLQQGCDAATRLRRLQATRIPSPD